MYKYSEKFDEAVKALMDNNVCLFENKIRILAFDKPNGLPQELVAN